MSNSLGNAQLVRLFLVFSARLREIKEINYCITNK